MPCLWVRVFTTEAQQGKARKGSKAPVHVVLHAMRNGSLWVQGLLAAQAARPALRVH
ncbi:hypothetical protein RTM1035_05290 [Roseovarius sp. TM1035]|nr:hypothetical protein RTM1035_05290 [Roseovarius sp. TM1035]